MDTLLFEQLSAAIAGSAEVLILYLILSGLLEKRAVSRKISVGVSVCSGLALSVICYMDAGLPIQSSAAFAAGLLMAFFLFGGPAGGKVYTVLSAVLLIYIFELLATAIGGTVGQLGAPIYRLTGDMAVLAAACVLKNRCKPITISKVLNISWQLLIFPGFGLLFIGVSSLRKPGAFGLTEAAYGFSALALVFVGLLLLFKTAAQEAFKRENNYLRAEMEKQAANYRRLEIFQQRLGGVWHDFRNHMICINGLLEQGAYRELKEYLEQTGGFVTTSDRKTITGHPVFDSLIQKKASLARQNGISFDYTLRLPGQVEIAAADLCIVLGNILDNAMEACVRIKPLSRERFVRLEVGFKNGYLHFSVENTSDKVTIKNGRPDVPEKADKGHGIGLKNVEDAVKKYRGNLCADWKQGVFKLMIMMKNRKE